VYTSLLYWWIYKEMKVEIYFVYYKTAYHSCTSSLCHVTHILFPDTSHSNCPSLNKVLKWKIIEVIKESAKRKKESGSSKIQLKRCKSTRLNPAKIISNYLIIWKCTKINTWKVVLCQEPLRNFVACHGFTENAPKASW